MSAWVVVERECKYKIEWLVERVVVVLKESFHCREGIAGCSEEM